MPTSAPRLADFFGQAEINERVTTHVLLARKRGEALGHLLICGEAGEGRQFLARCIAQEMGVNARIIDAPSIERPVDIASILSTVRPGEIAVIGDIDNLQRRIVEVLAPAMRDFYLDITLGKGTEARPMRIPLPAFTVIGITSFPNRVDRRIGELFYDTLRFSRYEVADIATFLVQSGQTSNMPIEMEAAREIAKRADGSLRQASSMLRRVSQYAALHDKTLISIDVVAEALKFLNIDGASIQMSDLTGRSFELKCLSMLQRKGYDVKLTGKTADGGIDIVATSHDPIAGGRYIVQCKDWGAPVGAPVVRDLYGVVHAEDAVKGILIARSSFTADAEQFAAGKR